MFSLGSHRATPGSEPFLPAAASVACDERAGPLLHGRPGERRRAPPACGCASPDARSRSTWRPASSRPAGSTRAPPCCSTRRPRPPPDRHVPRPRLRLGAGRPHPGPALPRGHRVGRRRQRARARPHPAQRRAALGLDGVRRGHRRRHPGRRAVRPDLVQPADPGRQGGAARPAAHLAPPAGPRRGRPPRRAAQPRVGLAAAVDPSTELGMPCTRLTSSKGFRVLEVRRA